MRYRLDIDLIRHAMIVLAGHRYWLLPFLPLAWLIFQGVVVYFNPEEAVTPGAVQGALLGVPMTALAVFLGMRVIGAEVDEHSLEIAYTVPGGCERMWFAKLGAALLLIVAAEVLLAIASWLFFTHFPPGALYGALQAATFYLVVSTAMCALLRGEASGAIATCVILAYNALITDFGDSQIRISPFFNPYALQESSLEDIGVTSPSELLGWTVQNRIGMVLVMAGVLALGFMRANRREKMLSG